MSVLTHLCDYENFINKFKKFNLNDLLNDEDNFSETQCIDISKSSTEDIKLLNENLKKLNEIDERLCLEKDKIKNLLDEIEPDLILLKDLKNLKFLLQKLENIKKLYSELNKSLKNSNKSENKNNLFNLFLIHEELIIECKKLLNVSSSEQLNYYLKIIVLHWNDILKSKFEVLFNSNLKSIQWPITSACFNLEENYLMENKELLKNFKSLFEILYKLDEINNDFSENQINNTEQIKICLPIHIMVLPLKKRFIFHFHQQTKTNRLDKPEWFLTQVLNWIKNHEEFLEVVTDSILIKNTNNFISTKVQFISFLLELVKKKIEINLIEVLMDDKLFAHLFDETLIFIKEIKNFFDENSYEIYKPYSLIDLFLEEPYFSRLISLENQKCVQYVENILSSATSWNKLNNSNLDDCFDDLKVPECIDKFIILLQSITNKFKVIKNNGPKLVFANLQINILDDFRLRLAQLINSLLHENSTKWPLSNNFFAIINGLNYLIIVLEDWKFLPVFMEISEYSSVDSVFSETIDLLKHLMNKMQENIIESFSNQIRINIIQYSKVKWFCLNEEENNFNHISYKLFFFISSSLDLIKRMLASNIFEKLIRILIEKINKNFINDLILKCTFNEFGVQKLTEDINTNLIPLFKTFFDAPEKQFIEILDCLKLLNLQKGTILLLKETLNCDDDKLKNDTLADFNVDSISLDLVLNVLNKKIFLN